MKYLLWVLGLFAVAVAFAIASQNSAYVLVVYPPYRIELSFTLFVASLLMVILGGYALLRFVAQVLSLPSYVRKFRQNRMNAKSKKLQQEILTAFFEGRYIDAEKVAEKAIKQGELPSLYSIIAARSAHELKEYGKRDAYMATIDERTAGDTTLRLMTATKFMLDQHDPHGALKTLQALKDVGSDKHLGAMTMELKAQQQIGNWDAVLKLLDQMERRGSMDEAVATPLRQQAWLEKINNRQNLADLQACLKSIPSAIKRQSKIVATAARALIKHNGCNLAQQLIADSLNSQWDSELVALYGECCEGDAIAQIEQAEKWLLLHQKEAELLLSLGKLCLHQKLWGKAQNYLDASVSLKPSYEAYSALGKLAESLGKSDDANGYLQRAMKLK